MKREIKLQMRNRYGRDLIYPMCLESHYLCELVRRKTFLDSDLVTLSKLGYEITWVAEKPKEASGD